MTQPSQSPLVDDMPTVWQNAQSLEQSHWQSFQCQPELVLEQLGNKVEFFRFVQPYVMESSERTLLEVGCGPLGIGCLTPFLPRNFQIHLVDPLHRVEVDYAEPALRQFVNHLRERVSYDQARGERLPFGDDIFGAVLCENALDHTENPKDVLLEMRRVLRPEGLMLLSLNTFSQFGRWRFELRRKVAPTTNQVLHPHTFTLSSLERLIVSCGFSFTARQGCRSTWSRFLGSASRNYWVCRKEARQR